MADKKQTLYELLGVSPNAPLADIKAAHHARTRALILGDSGLPREEVNHQLQILDVALSTLSSQWSRDAYDAELAARAPGPALPALATAHVPSLGPGFNALRVADELQQTYKTSLMESEAEQSLVVLAKSAAGSVSALKKIFRAAAGMLVLFIVIKGSMGFYGATHHQELYAKEKAAAEDKVIIQDYYQKHGVRVASRAEAEMLEQEARRQGSEQRKAEEAKHAEEVRERQFAEEGRREAEQVSRNLQASEAQARAEEERKRQEEAWAKERERERQAREEELARERSAEQVRRDEELVRQRARDAQWRQPNDAYQGE